MGAVSAGVRERLEPPAARSGAAGVSRAPANSGSSVL